MPASLSKSQIDKLGNTMIYFSDNVGEFGITKALKMLFLIEERSIKTHGIPFFGFEFKVWQFGPVVEPVYIELNDGPKELLVNYVEKIPYGDETLFRAKGKFNDDEFSANDIMLLREMVEFARHKTASDFVRITHAKNSLWSLTAKQNNLKWDIGDNKPARTEISIDFSPLFKDNEYFRERYEDYLDFLRFNQYVNA